MKRHRNRLTFGALILGLAACGCGSDETFDFSLIQNAAQQQVPPVAVADTFAVLGNGQFTGSVTANDTVNGALVSQFSNPGTAGGSVQISATGQLTYLPPAGQSNVVDTFTYTLTNGAGSSVATVTINVGAQGFFVKNDVPPGGTGSFTNPFNTLLAAVTAAAGVNGAQVVVFRGDGLATGQNVAVALSANQAIVAQDPASPPTISGSITLASNCTLSNLRLVGNTGPNAVAGTGIVGATLSNLTVANTTGHGVNMTNPTGTVTMTGLAMNNLGPHGLPLSTNAGGLNYTVTGLTVNNTTANVSLGEITGTSVVNATFTNVTCTNVGTVFPFNLGFEWNARNTANCTLAVSNYRFDTGGSGMFFTSSDSSNTAVLVSNANITNCSDRGIVLSAFNNGRLLTRLTNSRLLGNAQGFRAQAGGNAALCARLTSNTSDSYQFSGASTIALLVENLPGVSTENTGTSVPTGNVQDAAIGSCGIP